MTDTIKGTHAYVQQDKDPDLWMCIFCGDFVDEAEAAYHYVSTAAIFDLTGEWPIDCETPVPKFTGMSGFLSAIDPMVPIVNDIPSVNGWSMMTEPHMTTVGDDGPEVFIPRRRIAPDRADAHGDPEIQDQPVSAAAVWPMITSDLHRAWHETRQIVRLPWCRRWWQHWSRRP